MRLAPFPLATLLLSPAAASDVAMLILATMLSALVAPDVDVDLMALCTEGPDAGRLLSAGVLVRT